MALWLPMMKTARCVVFITIWVAAYFCSPLALFSAPPLSPSDLVLAAGPPDVGYFERADCTTLNAVAYQTTCKNTGSGGTLLQGMMYVYNGSAWQGVYPSIGESASAITTTKDLTVGSGSTETLSKAQLTAMKVVSITIIATATDNGRMFWRNNKAAMTISQVFCQSDSGTPSINIQRDDGSPANILSSGLACSTSGTTSTSFSGTENAIAANHKLIFTTDATTETVTVQITATLD